MFVRVSLHFIFLPLLLHLTLSYSLSIPKSGCPKLCGNLSIPYPFGVGPGCSMEPSFDIICNTTFYPPRAYLPIIQKEAIEINPTDIRVKYPNLLASACYDLSDYESGNATTPKPYMRQSIPVNLTGTLFALSEMNRLTVIGCDDMVFGITEPQGGWMTTGCSVSCLNKNNASGTSYCPANFAKEDGYGCCQGPIPLGTSFLRAELIDVAGKLKRRKMFGCSHAFIQEEPYVNETVSVNETSFSYPLYYLDNLTALVNDNWASATRTPVVRLNWFVRPYNCSQAKILNDNSNASNSRAACQDEKSICIDSKDNYLISKGHLCSCAPGYDGNPYLPGSCKLSFPSSIAKPGCLDQCGMITIPFPFGVGPGCYLAPSFNISCNTTSNPPKAYLAGLNLEVIEMNSSNVLVDYQKFGLACYNLSRGMTKTYERSLIIDLSGTQYTLSDENWISVVGCNDMVVASIGRGNRTIMGRSICTSVGNEKLARSYAICPYPDLDNYSHLGDSCCRAAIPRGTTYLEASLTESNGRWQRSDLYCSYSFVEYKYLYNQPHAILYDADRIGADDLLSSKGWDRRGLVLDWRIGRITCEEAQSDPSNFACGENSHCVDFNATIGGYLCICSQGYRGNPYLVQGCQDIDECADSKANACHSNSKCTNYKGYYECSCAKGYHGDGRIDGTDCSKQPPSKTKMMILISIGSGLGGLLLLLMLFRIYKLLQKRKEKILKDKFFKRNGGLLLRQQTSESTTLGKTNIFTAKELEVATDHFNENRVLGRGGQGTVYKGMLSDGKIVAVKKSKLVEEKHLGQFINEVVILSQINHRNVVRLLGCCLETDVPLLVYEFMPNGTLFELIHNPNNEYPVAWNMRLKMAADIAGALAYLHSASSIPIYHRDIKSSNILLDEKNVVKVADFGTSMSVALGQTHLTTVVKGTFGYLDPEYFRSSQFTEKSDVYSFGVVLVELLTGKRPISHDETDEERSLAMRFLTCIEENNLDTILDPHVLEQSGNEEVVSVASLAQRCLNLKGKMRPTMKEVTMELESVRISQTPCSIVIDDFKEKRDLYSKSTTLSSTDQYTWSTSYNSSVSGSFSAAHPLMYTHDRVSE